MSSILSIGKSALAAAQAGLATTGHNIANAATPGYSRQEVLQTSAGAQNLGSGYIGKGTAISDVRRIYSDILAGNVRTGMSAQGQTEAYYTQLNQINNVLANSSAGLSPTLQDFFASIQNLASHPNANEARQSVISAGQTLVSRFQALDGQMRELAGNVNSQIESTVTTINTYAEQIAKLNDAIELAAGAAGGKASNDLLDQRDHAITELSREIKTTVVRQGNSYNVFVGNGQPLVVGANDYKLTTVDSEYDPTRTEVGYLSNGKIIELGQNSLSGGRLGGLLEFRSKSLDPAFSALGRVAIGLASTFNAQHRLGVDQNGANGGDFFSIALPTAQGSKDNTSGARIQLALSDAGALTGDEYELTFNGAASYTLVNRTTGERSTGPFDEVTSRIKGVTVSAPSPAMANGESFLIAPARSGAADIKLAVTDVAKLAAGSPAVSSAPTGNTGSGKISAVTVNSSVLMQAAPLSLTYAGASPGGTLSGFPANQPVSVTRGATTTSYPAGTASVPYDTGDVVTVGGVALHGIPAVAGAHPIDRPYTTLQFSGGSLRNFPDNAVVSVRHANGTTATHNVANWTTTIPYAEGDTFSFGGISVTITGTPVDGDSFVIGPNPTGAGDNRNALALGALQTAKTMAGGTTTYQGAYGQLVSAVGNKTRELEVSNKAETKYLEQAEAEFQAESGVNLDEEAANLMRYQQAYQAAAKMMQTASQLFDMLLQMGG
ncbi:flagellar hook-associated protein FlgK [Noviherbaspirillum aridicola]|uniref:Flagellar hook-associated protein 1 n=1 Tax=Noviherbaspirillum aridicola TaxID=2849687 RepID=A0ABQ4Q6V8_9BURK|nr:flagellar hook-associated protein FlgK [Noviherbaspirillum aridicola]GIZ52672.1 flagellar hook-associated protein FlgK [Noviherbaspirillum aridicola]